MFEPYAPPPKVAGDIKMAMDDNITNTLSWAALSSFSGAAAEGMEFLGYPLLSVLAQRAEYRRISEVIATEMTRKWITIQAASGDDKKAKDKSKRIDELNKALLKHNIQHLFREAAEKDGFFGRGHLYIKLKDDKNPEELAKSIGPGNDELSKTKCAKGSLVAFKVVEAVWCYPNQYNSNDPLDDYWYKPKTWQVMGRQIHHTRLLPFIGREVPDLLKAAYAFGGLSLTQMAKPYVDNWLRARQSVSDLVYNYSVSVLKTDMSVLNQDGGEQALNDRVDFFNMARSNRGTMLIDKDAEDFGNISVPLGSIDALQQQAQEHIASVCGIPIVKLLGIQPSGLNASSEGEIRVFYDWIGAYQEKLFRPHLQTVIWFIMLDLWGEIDEDITFVFEPLLELTVKEKAEVRKIDADTGAVLVQGNILHTEEERKRVAADPDSPYASLDVDDVPEATEEEAKSLEPDEDEDGDRDDEDTGKKLAA